MEDISTDMLKYSQDDLLEIWKIVKNRGIQDLPPEQKRLAEIMLLHKETFADQFESGETGGGHDSDSDDTVNPVLHISIHAIIQQQLEKKDPVEVFQFYNAMRNQKCPHHDALHLIAAILTPALYDVLESRKEFNRDAYIKLLKRYKKRRHEKIMDLLDKEVYTE